MPRSGANHAVVQILDFAHPTLEALTILSPPVHALELPPSHRPYHAFRSRWDIGYPDTLYGKLFKMGMDETRFNRLTDLVLDLDSRDYRYDVDQVLELTPNLESLRLTIRGDLRWDEHGSDEDYGRPEAFYYDSLVRPCVSHLKRLDIRYAVGDEQDHETLQLIEWLISVGEIIDLSISLVDWEERDRLLGRGNPVVLMDNDHLKSVIKLNWSADWKDDVFTLMANNPKYFGSLETLRVQDVSCSSSRKIRGRYPFKNFH